MTFDMLPPHLVVEVVSPGEHSLETTGTNGNNMPPEAFQNTG
jgi:hypothetical protein